MAKYKLCALESWVTVVPASEMIFRHLITGEEVGKRLPVPHPNSYYASQGKTLADYLGFCFMNCGTAARYKMVKHILEAK